MKPPSTPPDQPTSGQGSFDHYARLARRLLRVPVGLVTLVEPDRQVFPGAAGLQEPYRSSRETPLSHSFCQHVVRDEGPLILGDARLDDRVADNPAIVELDVIAYAGWPLIDETGRTVGSVCAIDHQPREWTAEEVATLEDLALACSAELQHSLHQSRESESLTRAIFEAANVALAFYDSGQRLVMANTLAEDAAERAGFRLDRPPYAGPNVRRFDNETKVPPDEQFIPRALRHDLYDHEMEWVGPPGTEIALVASWQEVFHADGTSWGTLIAAHDVTDLARSLQVKDEFISTVSHELRTPLTSIRGYAELLSAQLEPMSPFVAEALSAIERGAVNLQERIGQLLDVADRRRKLDLQPTNVSALVEHLLSTFDNDTNGVSLTLASEGAQPEWAILDARRVQQAIEHLISNALKHSRREGDVELTVEGGADTVRIVVSDDGVGMSPDEVSRAPDAFWRGDLARREAVQGIGIGLTFVRDVAEAHHGSVHIDSHPGRGTTVGLVLPRSSAGRASASIGAGTFSASCTCGEPRDPRPGGSDGSSGDG